MRRRVAVIIVAATMLSSGPLCAQAPRGRAALEPFEIPNAVTTQPVAPPKVVMDKAAVASAASASIRALGLQTEFPAKVDPVRIPIPAEVLWLAIAIAIALILYALRDALPFWRRASDDGWDTPADDPATAALQRQIDALAAADALSREGRFVEAMHALLLQSLADIRQHLDEQFADSLTSREILRGTKLTTHGRASLHRIVAAVERTYFGAYPAMLDDYAACRRNFESLRDALRGGTPA